MTQNTIVTGDHLFNKIRDEFYRGKVEWPTSIIAVKHDNALYFLYSDAELIASLCHKKLETVHGAPFCIIDIAEHNDIAICLYENKCLMCVQHLPPSAPDDQVPPTLDTVGDFFEHVLHTIIKPYNESIQRRFKLDKDNNAPYIPKNKED